MKSHPIPLTITRDSTHHHSFIADSSDSSIIDGIDARRMTLLQRDDVSVDISANERNLLIGGLVINIAYFTIRCEEISCDVISDLLKKIVQILST